METSTSSNPSCSPECITSGALNMQAGLLPPVIGITNAAAAAAALSYSRMISFQNQLNLISLTPQLELNPLAMGWNTRIPAWNAFWPKSRRKGGQVRFTAEQTNSLETRFETEKYLSPSDRRKLAKKLDLSERQVKTWFQNRRAKWRRQKSEDSPDEGKPNIFERDSTDEDDIEPCT